MSFKRLVLFDIDNTLIKATKLHHKAMAEAMTEVFGVDFDVDDLNIASATPGFTDLELIKHAMEVRGVEIKLLYEKLDLLSLKIKERLSELLKDKELLILPGVKKLLPKLYEQLNPFMGVFTGNVEPVGWLKLEKAGLSNFFSFGAFGNEAMTKIELSKVALKKAKKLFGDVAFDKVFIIGDTPRDVKAGKSINAKTIAVATGSASKKSLIEAGADLVCDNFEECFKSVIDLILS